MPSAEESARMREEQDSIAEVAIVSRPSTPIPPYPATAQHPRHHQCPRCCQRYHHGSGQPQCRQHPGCTAVRRLGIFGPSANGSNEVITIANEHLQIAINTFGARPNVIRLKEYKTYHGRKPLLLAVPDSGTYEYNFFLGNRKLSTKDMNFTAEKLGGMGVRLRAATTDPGKYLQITYQWMRLVVHEHHC